MPDPIPVPMQAPVIPMGSGKVAQVFAPVIRGGLQGGIGKFMLDGLQTFNLWNPSPDQREWVIIFLSMVVAAVQWAIEVGVNRKLLGAAPTPATRDDVDEEGLSQVGMTIVVAAVTCIIVVALLKVFNLL